MRIKDSFELRCICGEKIIIACGKENIDFSKIIALNETAAFLWEEAKKSEDFSIDSLIDALCENYEVEKEQAANDVKEVVSKWQELGIIA